MKTRIFLTGASGYLGGVLTTHLARLPEVEAITGIGLTPPTPSPSPKVRFQAMDIRSPNLKDAMAGHDVVIHAAAIVFWSARMPAQVRDQINLEGTRNVARAALSNGVRRFLHTSSMAVYDPHRARGQTGVTEEFAKGGNDSFLYYWTTKAACERILEETLGSSSLLLTCLRPIYIIGPRNHATVSGLRKNAINFPRCDPRRQFIHEDDVAAAFIHALQHDLPGAYNVVPDDYMRMSDVWRSVGVKSVRTVPVWLARGITWLKWRYLGSPIHPSWVQDILVDFTGSNEKLKSTGWQPRYRSAEALSAALEKRD